MNTVRVLTTTLVGIVTTFILSAGAASARPVPDEYNLAPVTAPVTAPPSRVTPDTPSRQSGDGSEIPVLAVTAIAGLALGAAGSSASRRLRNLSGLPA